MTEYKAFGGYMTPLSAEIGKATEKDFNHAVSRVKDFKSISGESAKDFPENIQDIKNLKRFFWEK